MEERVISTQIQEEDLTIETSLRPQTLIDYIGQAKTKFKSLYRSSEITRGSIGSRTFFRTAGAWENHACRNYRK